MLFHIRMDVNMPHSVSETEANEIKLKEKIYAQDLQQQGKWRHLWRIAGEYSNISIFDVDSVEEPHTLLSGLPLFPYMQIKVMPLCRHPSSIWDSDK